MNINLNMSSDSNLEDIYNGYIKGNLFKNLYEPYKNYRPVRLIPNNEQAEMLLNVNQLEFASHELRLLLDVYPNNTAVINKFNDYQARANDAIVKYENKYGPIMENSLSNSNLFSWEASPWPWEMEEK